MVWKQSLSEFKSCERTHFAHLLRSATLLHFMTMEYITSNKGGRKLAFKNNIYIKQKVLSNGTVWGDIMGGFCPGGFCPAGFCPRGDFVQGDFVRGGFVRGDFVLEPSDTDLGHIHTLLVPILNDNTAVQLCLPSVIQ